MAETVFKRYEHKYLITRAQKEALLEAMRGRMHLDRYGRTTICNLYFDTPSYRLIRRSLEKPTYKEKLRLRAYGPVGAQDTVFVELKKKYRRIVYKRRIALAEEAAMRRLLSDEPIGDEQIAREIEYFRAFYAPLSPAVYLSYEREAYFSPEDRTLRVTFDENILCRTQDLSLRSPPYGTALLGEDEVLLEVKAARAMPLWLVHFLSEEGIRRTSFSKYGLTYQTFIHNAKPGGTP